MISNELVIQRWQHGVKLLNPTTASEHPASISAIMNLPMNFYFMDSGSIMQKMNDSTAATCGYLSAQDGVGKSIRSVARCEKVQTILANDREVVNTQTCKIAAESYTRLDDIELTALSIKYPWYQENGVIGILGCSILLGYDGAPSLSEALALLIQTGLLTPHTSIPMLNISGNYFDQRDQEILAYLVRGKTAKNTARIMGISHRTIEHRIESMKRKLRVTTKADLIEYVIDHILNKNFTG